MPCALNAAPVLRLNLNLKPCRLLEERAREYNIHDLAPLLGSDAFGRAGFRVDSARQAVVLPR